MDIKSLILKSVPNVQTYRFFLQKFLKRFFVFLRYLPSNSTIIGPPRGFHLDAASYNKQKGMRSLVKEYIIKDKSSYIRKLPITNSHLVIEKFKQYTSTRINGKTGFILPNSRYVSGFGGTVITSDDKIFIPASPLKNEWYPQYHQTLYKLKLPSLEKLDKVIIVDTQCAESNYGHWMMDHLPRFYWLEKMGIDLSEYTLVSGALSYKYQQYSYKVLQENGFNFRSIENKTFNHLQCNELVIPPYSTDDLNGDKVSYDTEQIDFLHRIFLKSESDFKASERIYISRRKSLRESPQEVELIKKLEKFNVKEVFLEDYNISEQAFIFNNAKLIIGFHGAGLTNINFCRPKTNVVEIFGANFIVTNFWGIANQLDLNYFAYCEDTELANVNSYRIARQLPASINVDSFIDFLKREVLPSVGPSL